MSIKNNIYRKLKKLVEFLTGWVKMKKHCSRYLYLIATEERNFAMLGRYLSDQFRYIELLQAL